MNPEPQKPFCDRLKEWRDSFGMTQEEAARSLDVPVGTYRTWEQDEKKPNRLAMAEIERRMNPPKQ